MDITHKAVFAAIPSRVDYEGRATGLNQFIGHDVVVVILEEYASSFAPIPVGTRVV